MTHPPSPTRTDSLTPGGSPAERLFDELRRPNTELTARLRFPQTVVGRSIERIRRIG